MIPSSSPIDSVRIVLVAGSAVTGAAVGKLAVPQVFRLSVAAGAAVRDSCPHCGGRLPGGWRGWVWLPNRCPTCATPLHRHAWIYPVAAFVVFAGLSARAPLRDATDVILAGAWLVLAAAGLVLAGIDLYVHRLPRPIVLVTATAITTLVATAALVSHQPRRLLNSALAVVAFAIIYVILAMVGPGLVGAGDIYLAGLLGLLLATGPLQQLLAGAVLPYLLGAAVVAAQLTAGRLHRSETVALGPYLLAGAAAARIIFPM